MAQAGHQYWYKEYHLIFSRKFLKYSTVTQTKLTVQITTSLDISPFSKFFSVDIFTAKGGNPEKCEIYL